MKSIKNIALGLAFVVASVASVSAVTVPIDSATLSATGASGGFSLVGGGLQNSANCPAERPCIRLNTNETAVLTFNGGDAFTLTSVLFSLSGTPAQLTITPSAGTPFVSSTFQGNNVAVPTGDLGAAFADIVSATFTNSGTGTVRIGALSGSGQITVTPAPVPLPAGGLLLVTGLVGFAALRRRKATMA